MEAVEPIRTKTDIEKMKRLFRQKSPRDYALFTLGLNTGLRISDLLALKVGDVLAGTGSRLRIADRITLRERKTGKRRIIMLNTTARDALAFYLRTRERRWPEDPLFLSRKRTADGSLRAITTLQAYRIIVKTARGCGITSRIGTHTMRKTFGYFLYDNGHGKPIEFLMKIFGHSSPDVTLRYIGITQDEIDETILDFSL